VLDLEMADNMQSWRLAPARSWPRRLPGGRGQPISSHDVHKAQAAARVDG
jgi:hypothetical protein